MLANVVGCKCRTTELLPIIDLHAASTAEMCCTPTRNNKRHLPRRATRLSVSPRWPARANAGKTASALRIADLKLTDSTCSSSSATWNDVRFELKHRARMGAT